MITGLSRNMNSTLRNQLSQAQNRSCYRISVPESMVSGGPSEAAQFLATPMGKSKLFAKAATDAEIIELQERAEKLDDLAANPQTRHSEYLALHEKLHHRIAECARCPALTDAIGKIFALASPGVSLGARAGALPTRQRKPCVDTSL